MRIFRDFLLKYKGLLSYLFFGFLTTLVNFLVYFPLYNWFSLSAAVSNAIAWLLAVLFAYLTNKPFVFDSRDWSVATVIPEATKFIGCRIGTGLLETLFLWLLVDWYAYDGNWVKIIISILVVVLNYISSKWLVFRKGEKG